MPDQSEPPRTPRKRIPKDEAVRHQGLFPCEAEIARRLSQSPKDWAARVHMLEREGLPRIDPIMGGRFWPAVVAFWDKRYGLAKHGPSQPDGEEDLSAF